ncbi:manganese efflux pump MntP [Haliovirga abyssi]|uniref:manganese efflux pump MntP n=1 Tax=Haliovirga abyssi TaxID=2996794 RepID=UPI0027DD58E9|nr:manganese efflux pump MntP family protein [Haliovirga abyssi]
MNIIKNVPNYKCDLERIMIMSLVSILLIAIGLAMDAFAVSISSGIAIKNLKIGHSIKIGSFFGVFQAIMPILGWLAGNSFVKYAGKYSRWVAFLLLLFIGGKMIYESFVIEESEAKKDVLSMINLLLLAIATSIDALAVGVTFSLLKIDVMEPSVIIGIVTFFISVIGVYLGNKLGDLFGNKIEIIGGIILIGIGVKILVVG